MHEADGFDPINKIVYAFNGCYFHGCEENCPAVQKGDVEALNRKSEKFRADAVRLLEMFPNDIKALVYVQECVWNAAKKANPSLRALARNMRPLRHLSFREAYR